MQVGDVVRCLTREEIVSIMRVIRAVQPHCAYHVRRLSRLGNRYDGGRELILHRSREVEIVVETDTVSLAMIILKAGSCVNTSVAGKSLWKF